MEDTEYEEGKDPGAKPEDTKDEEGKDPGKGE